MLREQPTDQLKDKTDRPSLHLKSRGLNHTNHRIADTSNVLNLETKENLSNPLTNSI